jgi:hypothetical protein
LKKLMTFRFDFMELPRDKIAEAFRKFGQSMTELAIYLEQFGGAASRNETWTSEKSDGGSGNAPQNTKERGASIQVTDTVERVPPAPEPEPKLQVATPPVAAPVSAPVAPRPTENGLLDDATVTQLETIFASKAPKHIGDCVNFLMARGQLQRGDGLNKLSRAYANKIIAGQRAFHTAVENFVKQQGQPV